MFSILQIFISHLKIYYGKKDSWLKPRVLSWVGESIIFFFASLYTLFFTKYPTISKEIPNYIK